MSSVEELSADETRAYELISSRNGLPQSRLWKELDADSRTGSRLATSLAEKGLIEREEIVSDGRTTYLLTPTDREESPTRRSGNETETAANEESGSELRPREQQGLSLVRERNGIYQSEFWKELDVSSRTGSRIASNLEEEGLIRREEATYDGQRTYLLRPETKELDFSLLMAGDEISPLVGSDGNVDPITSEEFSHWVLQLSRER